MSKLSLFVSARHLLLTCAAGLALPACTTLLSVPPPPPGLTEVMDRPAERNLLLGLRAYDDGLYPEAEKALGDALRLQLVSARDRATAHKTLAFIYCATERRADCEKSFRAAKLADPAFELSKAEAGHPVWGPVYAASRR